MSVHALALKLHGSTKHTTSVAEVQSQARTGTGSNLLTFIVARAALQLCKGSQPGPCLFMRWL
jgi:hypothetical protein